MKTAGTVRTGFIVYPSDETLEQPPFWRRWSIEPRCTREPPTSPRAYIFQEPPGRNAMEITREPPPPRPPPPAPGNRPRWEAPFVPCMVQDPHFGAGPPGPGGSFVSRAGTPQRKARENGQNLPTMLAPVVLCAWCPRKKESRVPCPALTQDKSGERDGLRRTGNRS